MQKVMSALINAAEWRMIMRDFADLVSAGEFNKFDYQAWKRLHETYDEDVLIDLWRINHNWNNSEFEYVISTSGRTYSFVDSDCSLGEFLYDNVLNEDTYLYKNSPKTGRVGWTDLIHNIEYTQYYDNICGGLITTSSNFGTKSAATAASATVAACSTAVTGESTTATSAIYDDSLCSKITTGYLSIDDYDCGCAKGTDGLEGIAKADYCDYDNAKGVSEVIDKICTDYHIGDDLSTDYSYHTSLTTPSYDYNIYSPLVGEPISNKTDSISIRLDEFATIEDVNHKMDEMKQAIADAMKDVIASAPLKNNNNKEKEESKMKGFNFDFGPCDNSKVRMSMYGLAVKNAAGTWVSYNPKSKEVVDVDVLNFDGAKYMYKMPAALKDVAVGDVIVHNHKPMFVTEVTEDRKNLTVIDVYAGEEKHVIPTVNMFGFNFVTKVVSLFNTVSANAPSPDAPFGNMLPLLMLSEGGTDKIDPMMLMCMMGGTFDMSNPMMMYFLLGDNKIDPLALMLMGQMMNKPAAVAPAAPAAQ